MFHLTYEIKSINLKHTLFGLPASGEMILRRYKIKYVTLHICMRGQYNI